MHEVEQLKDGLEDYRQIGITKQNSLKARLAEGGSPGLLQELQVKAYASQQSPIIKPIITDPTNVAMRQ